MHVKHIEKIVFAVAIIFLIMAGLVSVFVKVQFSYMKEAQNGSEELAPQISPPVVINVPEGWNEYRDEGLGYGFAYPPDWELSLEDLDKTIRQGRSEQVALRKGNAKILIDPLGRRGADEFSDSVQIENELVNGVSWQHVYWPTKTYHRFTDNRQSLILKNDLATIGVTTIGGRDVIYDRRSDFRAHVYLEEVLTEVERGEAISVTREVLETLTLI